VKIDLREAVISSSVVTVKASAYMGHVCVVVPEGIPVDMYGFVLMGASKNRAGHAAPIQGAPLVRIRARGLWGGVTVRSGQLGSLLVGSGRCPRLSCWSVADWKPLTR
jgi:hypothetical protein